jgi:hypothetical protein
VGCSLEIFIQEKQDTQNPKKLNKNLQWFHFQQNFVTFSNKKLEFLRNFLILNLNKFIFGKLKEKKLYHKIGI